MNSILWTIGRFLRDFCISILLWAYLTLVAVTWIFARMTPEWAVLLRVSASVLNDLVWIPLGILMWGLASVALLRLFHLMPSREFLVKTVLVSLAAVFTVFATDTSFRLLFIPMAIVVVATIRKLATRRQELHLMGRYIPLGIVSVLTVVHYQGQMLPSRTTEKGGIPLKVMSYNIYCDAGHEDRLKVIDTIRSEDPDILCVIEYNFIKDGKLFARELGERYPFSVLSDNPRHTRTGSVIFSKYPVRKLKEADLKRLRNKWSSRVSIIFAEADVRGRKVNVVNYHLKSVGHYIEYIADKDYDLKWKMDWAAKNEAKYDTEKLIQAQSLLELTTTSMDPVILCGDLNDTPNSRVFHTLQNEFTNVFSTRGWGLGATFGEQRILDKLGQSPLVNYLVRDVIRIDHIFVSREIRVREARVVSDAPGSDHKPVVTTLEMD